MALSDKLTDLASRIKELEDAASATKARTVPSSSSSVSSSTPR
jgi:hypothetical protein